MGRGLRKDRLWKIDGTSEAEDGRDVEDLCRPSHSYFKAILYLFMDTKNWVG